MWFRTRDIVPSLPPLATPLYPMLFLAFVVDVINQALLAKQQNRPLDIFKII